jgi:transposase-like protein
MPRDRKIWSEEEEDQLLKDYREGRFAYHELARKYGVTVGSIRSKLYFLKKEGKITRPQESKMWSEKEGDQLLKDYREGRFDYEELAKKYGVTVRSIRSKLYFLKKRKNI